VPHPAAIGYRAFLSYSHRDTAWGKWLHRALESYRIDKDLVGHETPAGPVPKTLRPIFRDREDFSAGASLKGQTRAALEASEFIIVVCSPNAARSQYVNEEIRCYKALGRGDCVIPIIVDGEPGDPERECFPPALRFKVGPDGTLTNEREEPIAADARAQGDGKEVAMLKVVAGLLGLGLDEVVRRAEIARRHRKKLWMSLAGVFLFLSAAASGGGIFAYQNWIQKERSHDQLVEWANSVNKSIEKRKARAEASVATLLSELRDQEKGINDSGVDTPKLKYVKAQTLIIFAAAYQTLGNSGESLARAKLASEILSGLIANASSELRWRQFLRRSYEKLTGVVQPSKLDLQNQLSVAYQKIGNSLLYLERLAVALDWYRRSFELAHALQTANPSKIEWQSGLSVAYDKIGDASKELGNLAAARTNYAASLAIRARLAAADPDNAQLQRDLASAHDRLADVLHSEGKLAEALRSEEQSRDIVVHFFAIDRENNDWRRNLALNYRKLADIHRDMGQISKALDGYRESFEIIKQLKAQDPKNAEWVRDLAASYVGIGALLGEQGKLGEAEENFRSGIAILEPLEQSDPNNTDWQRALALVYDQVGAVLGRQAALAARRQDVVAEDAGKSSSSAEIFSEALRYYRMSLAIRDKLVARDPENLKWRYELGAGHGNLAIVLSSQGNLAQARNELEIAKETFQQAAMAEPLVPLFQHDLALAILHIGDLLSRQQQFAEALASYREALGILQDLVAVNIGWQYQLAIAHEWIASAYRRLGNLADALVELRKGRDIVAQLLDKLPQRANDLSRFDAEIAAIEADASIKTAN